MLSKLPIPILVGLIPFAVSFRTSSSSTGTVNGEVVAHASRNLDYVAIALGPVAIVLGILAVLSATKGPAETRTRSLVLAGLGILLGGLQIVRGLS